jgi:hypothetical protein
MAPIILYRFFDASFQMATVAAGYRSGAGAPSNVGTNGNYWSATSSSATGRTMYYKYNELRGVWEMGKKYIYNLDINLNEIVITESVANFVDAELGDITLD